ncbi:MAG: hypothetical protein WC678_03875 [Parcubacteria group bacterium]|jgi:hypothetical protein
MNESSFFNQATNGSGKETAKKDEKFSREEFDVLVRNIEIPSASEFEKKPKIEISDQGLEQLEGLEKGIEVLKEGTGVMVVVRCWNKKPDEIKTFVERMEKFKKNIPNLQGVILVINNEGEKDNITEKSLTESLADKKSEIPIVPIKVQNYTWTSGLNSAVGILNEMALKNDVPTDNIRVMNISFGVDLDEQELKTCNDDIEKNQFVVTARKTSEGANPFEKKEMGEDLWKKFKDILRFPNEAELAELAYTMRNTFNVISLKNIVDLGGFNPLCNGEGRKFSTTQPNPFFRHLDSMKESPVSIKGMEDVEFFMRLILGSLQSGDNTVIKELRKAMDNPVFYTDYDWNKMHEVSKIRKIGNEMTALSLIFSGLATKESVRTGKDGERKTVGLVKKMYVPKSMQDFYLRK